MKLLTTILVFLISFSNATRACTSFTQSRFVDILEADAVIVGTGIIVGNKSNDDGFVSRTYFKILNPHVLNGQIKFNENTITIAVFDHAFGEFSFRPTPIRILVAVNDLDARPKLKAILTNNQPEFRDRFRVHHSGFVCGGTPFIFANRKVIQALETVFDDEGGHHKKLRDLSEVFSSKDWN